LAGAPYAGLAQEKKVQWYDTHILKNNNKKQYTSGALYKHTNGEQASLALNCNGVLVCLCCT